MSLARTLGFGVAAGAAMLLALGLVLQREWLWQPAALALAIGVAIGLAGMPAGRGYQFTAWIVAAVTAGMIYPSMVLRWGEFDLRNRWLILIVVQLVMFGMGTQMRLRDFAGVARMPWGVLVAVGCQFTVMPLTGYALTRIFHFEPEIAAGIILIGSCASGLASNVMCYIAGANLALSITATACTTLLAPVMTPLWMKLLAGTLVSVDFTAMMIEIIKIVLVPIGAALLHDALNLGRPRLQRAIRITAGIGAGWLAWLALGGWGWLQTMAPTALLQPLALLGFGCAAVVAGGLYHLTVRALPALERGMPRVSMVGIVYFTTVTTAAGRDHLLLVGPLLFCAAALHNTIGYFLGYGLSRACRLDRASARAIAFEVGLQNGGMASGLAGAMGKLGTLGLAAAIFSPWMNISGSILANLWRRRPLAGGSAETRDAPAAIFRP